MYNHHKRKEAISEAIGILKGRNKKYYIAITLIFLAIFILSFIAGWQLYFDNKAEAVSIVQGIAQSPGIQTAMNVFHQHNYFVGFLLILGNNIKSVAILLFSGVIFLLPAFYSIMQANSLGVLIGISYAIKIPAFWNIVFAVVVGVLEFSTIILACFEGTKLGLSFIIKNKEGKKEKRSARFKQALIEALKIFVLIIAMLLVAAAIETIGIAVLK